MTESVSDKGLIAVLCFKSYFCLFSVVCKCNSRLYHSNTLPRRPSIIVCSLHTSSLVSALGRLYGSTASSSGFVIHLYDFVATMTLAVCLITCLVYEESSALDTRMVCMLPNTVFLCSVFILLNQMS